MSLHETSSESSPFAGRWIANAARSTQHSANRFQRAFIDFAVTGSSITMKHAFIDEHGRPHHGENSLEIDGHEHVQYNGCVVRADWHGDRAFETLATKEGNVVGRGTYEVSPDGATLTISSPESTIVLERTNAGDFSHLRERRVAAGS